jgi:tetratricopeptide (TPR) repeat protein
MQKDLDTVKSRMLELDAKLQQEVKEAENTGKNANLNIASTSTRIEKLTSDIQRIKGDIDVLRVGVTTGKLPGVEDEQEDSVGKTLSDLMARIEALEDAQKEMLTALKKMGQPSKSDAKAQNPKSEAETLVGIRDFRKAFDDKKYTQILKDVEPAIKRNSGNVKNELLYFEFESLYQLGRWQDSALKLDGFLKASPPANLKLKAQLRLGDCFRKLGDKDTAKIFYQELIDNSPKSAEGKDAAKWLKTLGG